MGVFDNDPNGWNGIKFEKEENKEGAPLIDKSGHRVNHRGYLIDS